MAASANVRGEAPLLLMTAAYGQRAVPGGAVAEATKSNVAVCPGLITSYTQIGGNHLGKKSDEFKTKSLRRKLQAASR